MVSSQWVQWKDQELASGLPDRSSVSEQFLEDELRKLVTNQLELDEKEETPLSRFFVKFILFDKFMDCIL